MVAGLGGDGEGRGAEDGVADVGVKAAIVAGEGADLLVDEDGWVGRGGRDDEAAPGGLLFFEPRVGTRGEPCMGTLAPPTRAGSWGSRPYLMKLPLVPWRRKRGALMQAR